MKTDNFLAITLIELDNTESPNIGTITSQTGDEEELFKKAIRALESHFDAEVETMTIQDGFALGGVRNNLPLDAEVELVDYGAYRIEIQQTFIY